MPIETLRPIGAGDLTELTKFGAAANWDCCDEDPSDGDATYVRSPLSGIWKNDLYAFADPALIAAGDTINSVTVRINCRSVSALFPASAKTKIKTNGAVFDGASNNPPAAYTVYSTTYNTNPQTLVAWTLDELIALQAGVAIQSTEDDDFNWQHGRCTQVWIVVAFTVAGAQIPQRMKVGIGL